MQDKSLAEFLEWSNKHGVQYDGVEVRSAGEGAGNGVFGKKCFREEERFIQLPQQLMLVAGRVADMPVYKEIITRKGVRPTPFELLTLFFCIEEPSTSFWGPYLNVLPKDFSTPAAEGKRFNPDEIPSTARGFYRTQLAELDTVWAQIQNLSDSSVFYDRFLWAWHVVNTRCIYVENPAHPLVDQSQGDTIAVIPFVDMLNHDPNAQGFAFYDKFKKVYCVRATRCVREGDELFVCYGPHDNVRLWIEYGFRLENNPNGKVQIPHDLFLELARKAGLEVTPQHEKALMEAGQPSTLYSSDEGPSWSLKTNMRILHLSKDDAVRWKEIVYADSEQRRRLISGESDSDDERERSETERERGEMQTLAKMLKELVVGIRAKGKKVNPDLTWAWIEQEQLVEQVIRSIS